MCILYIYIYIEREREIYMYMCVYIYIYIYISIQDQDMLGHLRHYSWAILDDAPCIQLEHVSSRFGGPRGGAGGNQRQATHRLWSTTNFAEGHHEACEPMRRSSIRQPLGDAASHA